MLVLLILPSVLAIDLTINQQTSDEVMIVDVNEPAIVDLKVTNNEYADKFLFYTFFGTGLLPSERIPISNQQTKDIQLNFYPRADSKMRGFTSFYYFIQNTGGEEIDKKITLNIIDLEDAFEIGAGNVDPESNAVEVYLYNKVNFDFKNLTVKFDSAFFNFEENVSILGAFQKKVFAVTLNKDDFNELIAGYYNMNAIVTYKEKSADIENKVKFVEKDILKTNSEEKGFLIITKTIEKSNQGNVVVDTTTTVKKSICSRLFTTFNAEPTSVERQGSKVYYTWKQSINPGETEIIKVRTNWLIPIIILVLIILIVYFTNKYIRSDVIIKKKVHFVRAKGGEFALNVSVSVQARKFVEKVTIIDRLPPLVRIYEKFLGEQPLRVDDTKKKIEWMFNTLQPGEKRILSYIIYSRVGVMGKFALPRTVAFYEKEGKIKESTSNKAYFVTEQIRRHQE
jgi:hypothetical protein